MELTVKVTNSSAALSCTWFANKARQFRNDPSDFYEVGGDRNQVYTSIIFSSTHARTHAGTHVHTYTHKVGLSTHRPSGSAVSPYDATVTRIGYGDHEHLGVLFT